MNRVKPKLKLLDRLRKEGKITDKLEKEWTVDFTKLDGWYHMAEAMNYGLYSKPDYYKQVALQLYIVKRYYEQIVRKPKLMKQSARVKKYSKAMQRKSERFRIKFVLDHCADYRNTRLQLIEEEIQDYRPRNVTVQQVLRAKYGQGISTNLAGQIRQTVDEKLFSLFGHNYSFVDKSENTIRNNEQCYYVLLLEALPQKELPEGKRRQYYTIGPDPYLKTGNKDQQWIETIKDIKHMKYSKPYRPKPESKEPKYAPVRSTDDYISDDRDYYDDYLTAEEEMETAQKEEQELKQWEIDKYTFPWYTYFKNSDSEEDDEQ